MTHVPPTADNSDALPILQVRGAAKAFDTESGGSVCAFEHLDLTVTQGELVTLIGPTGCGKSTLLNVVAGLIPLDAGELTLAAGLTLGHTVGYVFQRDNLFPWRTILANVAFSLAMQGLPRREREARARGLLSELGLSGFEQARPYELSGGMRQRAAMAQALAIQPELLLMDEPFGALDDRARGELQQMLERLWQDLGLTVLFVTHKLDEAVRLGDRVVVLSDRPGRVLADISMHDLPRPRDLLDPRFTDRVVTVRRELHKGKTDG